MKSRCISVSIQFRGPLDDGRQKGRPVGDPAAFDTGLFFLFGAVNPAGVRLPGFAGTYERKRRNWWKDERLGSQFGFDG